MTIEEEQTQLLKDINRTLKAHGGIESNIGVTDDYWTWVNKYRSNEKVIKDSKKA